MKDRRKIQVHRRCYERGGTRYVEKVVVIVVEKERPEYRFGRYTLDADLGVLVCGSRQQSCSYYERRLLVAFFRAPDHFLTFREIERIFGWEPAERGTSMRLRKLVSHVRSLFREDLEVDIKVSRRRNGYRLMQSG